MQEELKPFGISVTSFFPRAMDTALFTKIGDNADRSGALDPAYAADALVYVCGLPGNVDVPELGVQSLDYK